MATEIDAVRFIQKTEIYPKAATELDMALARAEYAKGILGTELDYSAKLRRAAKAFDACLSTDCDGPEREALRALIKE